ncbi:hypothetical protein K474DRAFT_1636767 [Panus rudis PR-1116 ss-1]|nr:hypothetical protein K474DRAFT_1636767 [Panus rudis PR-1116 ss-1]
MSDKMHLGEVHTPGSPRKRSMARPLLLVLCLTVATLTVLACNYSFSRLDLEQPTRIQHLPFDAPRILSQCAALKAVPGAPSNFLEREVSDRYEPGTNSTLIKNAKIWTGARNGTETISGDVLLENGIVKAIGHVPDRWLTQAENLTVVDADGAWLTPGLVDLHSHVGLLSAPFMRGTFDVNSPNGPVLPWLRSIDAFDTHDDAFELAIAGGVTSAQVLPGSGNAIGGQAFMVKLRKTAERSPTSMIIEPPHTLNDSDPDPNAPLRWRHMKQACGENLKKYGTRMDALWAFRSAYNEARKIKHAQDAFCAKAEAGLWNDIAGKSFPEDLKWEALVDVLRGRVRIANHCYEAVDLDDIVRLTNEFQFHIASFHHASEAWLVPGVLKRTFGGPPAVAVFASNHRYKREAYRGSEFAPRVLADEDIPVVMKSDHPVLNSRYLLFEAQQAHYYGLQPHLALSSVTTTPAKAAGMSHRIGILHKGADADVVLWDSHPLQLGAKPTQVWIDGIPQLKNIHLGTKSMSASTTSKHGESDRQQLPSVPNWDKERKAAVYWEGLPPLGPKSRVKGKIVLKNVREVWVREEYGVKERWVARPDQPGGIAVLNNGALTCVGREGWCFTDEEAEQERDAFVIDLHGGSIGPGLLTIGSPLGIEEMAGEVSTGDGNLYNPFAGDVPEIMDDTAGLVRAVDALQFGTRNALHAHRAGVTYATSSLARFTTFGGHLNLISGLSSTFKTGSAHALQRHAIVKPITALHIALTRAMPYAPALPPVSVSTQIATLRRLLLNAENDNTETGKWFKQAAEGAIPLVITVHSADIMASVLHLKTEIEEGRGSRMQIVFLGATESYILAKEIAKAKVGVVLSPARGFPGTWDQRRALPGPPLTNDTTLGTLLHHGVTVGLGLSEAWQPGSTRFEAAWAALDLDGRIDTRQTYDLVTTNLEKSLGIEGWFGDDGDLVIYDGGSAFDFSSKVVGIVSTREGFVELF